MTTPFNPNESKSNLTNSFNPDESQLIRTTFNPFPSVTKNPPLILMHFIDQFEEEAEEEEE